MTPQEALAFVREHGVDEPGCGAVANSLRQVDARVDGGERGHAVKKQDLKQTES